MDARDDGRIVCATAGRELHKTEKPRALSMHTPLEKGGEDRPTGQHPTVTQKSTFQLPDCHWHEVYPLASQSRAASASH